MGSSYGPLSKMQFRKLRRDGIVGGRQRRKCKSCGYRHTVRYRGASPAKKRQALELYLEGLGFRAIGRFLGCSHVAVYNWIGAFGGTVGDLRSDSPPDIVETDEMHTCIGSQKNYCRIWIAVDQHGRRFVDCVLGNRDAETGCRLRNAIEDKEIGHVMTDYWKPCGHFIPDGKHTQSKAETYTVEGYNSLLRHFLARLRRKRNASIFRHAFDAQVERRPRIHIKLTMPYFLWGKKVSNSRFGFAVYRYP